MDWFSWLSKSSLDASLIYEYGLLLSHNELEEEDIAHFDHEFLQSMGISIAKHRLEILKLAKKHKKMLYISPTTSTPVSRLLTVIDKTKSCLAKYVFQLFVHRETSSAIVVVPRARWKGIGMKRSNKMVVVKQGRLLLTGRSPVTSKNDNKPAVQNSNGGTHVDGEDDDDGYWGGDGHEKVRLRWDSMFQDLKPT
ncbi:hypothetical protein J5N97_027071 [Dioscorea zingiberensis]|uniref:SAM domain-containing protein n=1 Tax=Dioscorea zingiberensis TaxID=325984 RepID=A0A9D5C440_9LILI|nr:hypothetical protein J5N97_027071 [Dioscorea zingiberensis]